MSLKRKLEDCLWTVGKRVKTQSLAARPHRSLTVPRRTKTVPRPQSLPPKYDLKPIWEGRKLQKGDWPSEWGEDSVRKVAELRQMRKEDDLAHAIREQEIVKKLRKAMEFKAKPIPKYPPPCITRSTKKLTEPRSPTFSARRAHQHDYFK